MQLIKRNGSVVAFDESKIEKAIKKAMKNGSGIYKPEIAEKIANEIRRIAENMNRPMTIYQIEDLVFSKLVEYEQSLTAKAYEGYRAVQEFKRIENTTDDSILGLVSRTNEEVMKENSNKDSILASTQRDLIAGEVSKDITRRKLLPTDIVQAHDDGAIHLHDMDYALQPIHNCTLINIKDMLDNGTVINKKTIDPPKSFTTACNIMTQIVAQVANSQFGGQSVNIKHLGKYLKISRDKHYKLAMETLNDEELANKMADKLTKRELESGIQLIMYQINTFSCVSGQSPFLSLFLEIPEDDEEYQEEVVEIIAEILKQRRKGIKNEVGVYVVPTFPKLIYLLDENNHKEGTKYWWLTQEAVKTTSKAMYPDYISKKIMHKNYEGNHFSCMGKWKCSPIAFNL